MVEVNSILTSLLQLSKEQLEEVQFQVSVALTELTEGVDNE
tara:strand:- start:134 stop:256 length:123 start_codon:yes stop_codon:yes gene_type:complete